MGFLDAAVAGAKSGSRPPPPVSGGAVTRIAQAASQAGQAVAQAAAPSAVTQAVSQGASQGARQAATINQAAQAAQRAIVSPKQRIFDATLNNLLGLKGGPSLGVLATAYGPPWNAMEGGGKTSTGIDLTRGQLPVIAVDPSVIPYGSIVKASNSPLGKNKLFVAADTGGAIKGNHIDFFVASGRDAQNGWGARQVGVQVLKRGSGPDSVRSALQKVQATKAQVPPPQPPAAPSQRPVMTKERLFANPQRPASFAAGGAIQIAQSKGIPAMRQVALKLLVHDPAKRKVAAQQLASPSQSPVLVSSAPSGASQAPADSSAAAPSTAPATTAPAAASPAPAPSNASLAALPAMLQAAPIPANVAAQAKSAPILDALLRSAGTGVWDLPTSKMAGGGLRGGSDPFLLLADALLKRGRFR